MVVAITGVRGLLGKYLIKTQPQEQLDGMAWGGRHKVIGLTRKDLDVSNFAQVLEVFFKIQPDIIIHCAANGDVDDVENNSSEAVQTDLLGTINIKNYCEKLGCKLITLSSNAVYDGDNPPYTEESKRNPVNFYGKIKSLADDIIMKSTCEWLIIRPILMYGWGDVRYNWVTKIINNCKELRLVTDSFTQPTYAGDVAESIWYLIDRDIWKQTYNVASKEELSIYDFGMMVCDVFDYPKKLIKAARLSDFKTIAPRPVNTCFNTQKINRTGFEFKEVMEGLKTMKDEN